MLHNMLRAAAGNRVSAVPLDGLLAWYTMDNISGSTLVDDSGNGRDATIFGATQVSGILGQALSFDGSNDYVDADNAIIPSGDTFALCFWNYGETAKQSVLIRGYDSNGWRTVNIHLPWSDSNVYFDAGSVGPSSRDNITKAASSAEYLGWHHWVFQKDASSGLMEIYLDGASWHSGSGLAISIAASVNINIGRDPGGGSFHQADIDQWLSYNRILTSQEISGLYNEGA